MLLLGLFSSADREKVVGGSANGSGHCLLDTLMAAVLLI